QTTLAIIALVLTPVFSGIVSGIVVYFQLSGEHVFVESQRRLAREQARLDEKLRIQTKIATLIPSTKLTLTQIAVNALFLTFAMLGEGEAPSKLKDSFDKFVDKRQQLDGQLQSQVTELAGYLTAARHYYGEGVTKAIDAFGAYSNNHYYI